MRVRPIICFLLIAATLLCGCSRTETQSREVNLYVWSAYIPQQSLDAFEQSTGIRLNFSTYDSNEALLEKMESGVADYDVIVPSDYMVSILARQNLLQKLDIAKIPNFKNIGTRFRNPVYDSRHTYSVPFLWSTCGIGYNKKRVVGPVDSWKILWDPEYANHILMLDDPREAFGAALKWSGHSINSTDPNAIREARDLLLQQKPLLKAYNSTSFDELLLSGDAWIVQGWSGNLAMVMQQNPDLDYVLPKEGASLSVENFCIPVHAKNLEEAHAFINFMLGERVGAEITNFSFYPNTNEAASRYIRPELLKNPAVYPDPESLSRCEYVTEIGSATQLMDRYWTEIKSR
jgi:spermidine/putrescine-binding protein